MIGQAIDQVQNEQMIYHCAYEPIHRGLYRLLPLLEQRQEVCKRYLELKSKEEPDVQGEYFKEVIDRINRQIELVLNIPDKQQNT